MSLANLLTQPVTVRRHASTTDAEGNVVRTWATTFATVGRVEQTASQEITEGRTTVVSDWRAYLLPGTVIDAHDQVQADGRTFEVVGAPYTARTPRGPHHLRVRLRLAET